MKPYTSGPADAECSFSDLDSGWCLVHQCYLSDDEHPHVWEHCGDANCPCPVPDIATDNGYADFIEDRQLDRECRKRP